MTMTLSPGSYPTLQADLIERPNRFWAVPILGILVKSLLLIPVFIWLWLVSIGLLVLVLVNSLIVLFTGSYSQSAYDLALGFLRLNAKTCFYLAGLTNDYPGFSLAIEDAFSLDIASPEQPSRLFAIPIVGGLIRGILLIPFVIYIEVVAYATYIGVIIASFPVLFTGRYPESVFELVRDTMRLYSAQLAYGFGLSDSYPSFAISTSHGTVKGILVVAGVVLLLLNIVMNIANSTRGI